MYENEALLERSTRLHTVINIMSLTAVIFEMLIFPA